MRIVYRGIDLGDITEVMEFSHTPQHDSGHNYLYTKIRLHVGFYMNEDAVAYNLHKARVLAPLEDESFPPATTLPAIRHVLGVSRGQLIVTDAETEVLRCPAEGETTDAAFGPVVGEGPNIVEVIGSATYHGEWWVECYVNECSEFVNTVNALLSHRWEMTEEIDWQERCTRTITGRAVFNAQRLEERKAVPDDFRWYLFHPVPANFERLKVSTTATEDGTGLIYTVVDRSTFINITDRYVKKIEGCHMVSHHRPGLEPMVMGFANLVLQGAIETAQVGVEVGQAASGTLGPAGAAIVGVSGAMRTLARQAALAFNTYRGLLPKIIHTVRIKVWGAIAANHLQLSRVAHRLAAARFNRVKLGLYCQDVVEIRAIDDSCVEVHMTFTGGMFAALDRPPETPRTSGVLGIADFIPTPDRINALIGNLNVPVRLEQHFPQGSTGGTVARESLQLGELDNQILTRNTLPGKPFVNRTNCYGTELNRIAAAALVEPCGVPPRPEAARPSVRHPSRGVLPADSDFAPVVNIPPQTPGPA